jgi:hypothetical protein
MVLQPRNTDASGSEESSISVRLKLIISLVAPTTRRMGRLGYSMSSRRDMGGGIELGAYRP